MAAELMPKEKDLLINVLYTTNIINAITNCLY